MALLGVSLICHKLFLPELAPGIYQQTGMMPQTSLKCTGQAALPLLDLQLGLAAVAVVVVTSTALMFH
jgi:hypothetical protein